jgi:hypothetical protein
MLNVIFRELVFGGCKIDVSDSVFWGTVGGRSGYVRRLNLSFIRNFICNRGYR